MEGAGEKAEREQVGADARSRLLILDWVELVAEEFVHLEHIHSAGLENRLHLFVAAYLAFIFGILKVVCFNVLPQLFDNLRT